MRLRVQKGDVLGWTPFVIFKCFFPLEWEGVIVLDLMADKSQKGGSLLAFKLNIWLFCLKLEVMIVSTQGVDIV